MWMSGSWAGFPWMWVFPLFFLVVILILLFRSGGMPMCGGGGRQKREASAAEILDRRYARGEVSREEYQQIKKDLE